MFTRARDRGGQAADHVDILGHEEVMRDVVSVVTGSGGTLESRVVSNIDEIASKIMWEEA